RRRGSAALPVVEGRWQLVREIGLEYAEPSGAVMNLDLCWPIATERTAGGLRLVVDDPESDGSVPVRLQCRTTLLAADDRILFDTRCAGIPDGYGCLVDGGHLAILRRTRWDILLVKPTTDIYQRLDFSSISN